MAIICRDLKLLFIMVPATGCSVIGNVLQERFGGEVLPPKNIIVQGHTVVEKKHNSVGQILRHKILEEKELKEYLVFASVRNPFDRFTTYYQRLAGSWTEEYFAWTQRELDRQYSRLTAEEYNIERLKRERMIVRQSRRAKIIRLIKFNNWLKVTLVRWYLQNSGTVKNGKPRLLHFAYPMIEGVDVLMRYEYLEEAFNQVLKMVGVRDHVSLPRKNVTPGKLPYTAYYSSSTRYFTELMLRKELAVMDYRFDGPGTSESIILQNHISSKI